MGIEKDILIAGSFLNGSKTLINCLLNKEIAQLMTGQFLIDVEQYSYGTDNKVIITYMDNHTEQINLSDINDYIKASDVSINKVNIRVDSEFLKAGIRIIKTHKGFEDIDIGCYNLDELLSNAHTIIIILNAVHLFTRNERDFINNATAIKNSRNIFFVINRINQLDEDDNREVRLHVEMILRNFFVDFNGNFCREQFNKRVFYVDAQGAFKAKQNYNMEALYKTGFPKFENILMDTILFNL